MKEGKSLASYASQCSQGSPGDWRDRVQPAGKQLTADVVAQRPATELRGPLEGGVLSSGLFKTNNTPNVRGSLGGVETRTQDQQNHLQVLILMLMLQWLMHVLIGQMLDIHTYIHTYRAYDTESTAGSGLFISHHALMDFDLDQLHLRNTTVPRLTAKDQIPECCLNEMLVHVLVHVK